MDNEAKIKEMLNAIGALAEVSVQFYRAALHAGANSDEAAILLIAMLRALLHPEKDN